jgi:hypothetical protein
VDLSRAPADPATPAAKRPSYRAAYQRIGTYLRSRGAGRTGLTVVGG